MGRDRGRWGGSEGDGEGQRAVGRGIGRWGGLYDGGEGYRAVDVVIGRWEGTEGSLGSMGGV